MSEVVGGVGLQGAVDTKRHIFAGVLVLTVVWIVTSTVYKGAEGSDAAERVRKVIPKLFTYESECSICPLLVDPADGDKLDLNGCMVENILTTIFTNSALWAELV